MLKNSLHCLTRISVVLKISTEIFSCRLQQSSEFYVLAHLTGAIIHEDALAYNDSNSDIFSEDVFS